jgi:hypothetical protein
LTVRELEVARADVVRDRVAEHRFECVLGIDPAQTLPDDHCELYLPVHLTRESLGPAD